MLVLICIIFATSYAIDLDFFKVRNSCIKYEILGDGGLKCYFKLPAKTNIRH